MKRDLNWDDYNKSGIYKITNNINGKFYFGSTKCFASRYRTHLYALKSNKSGSIILQNAVNKYGIDNFTFSIIEVCNNYKEREIELFKELKSNYNAIIETKIKRELSYETKHKMSLSGIENYKNGRVKTSKKGRKFIRVIKAHVELLNINTTELLKFRSVAETAQFINCAVGTIYIGYRRNTLLKHIYKIKIIKYHG